MVQMEVEKIRRWKVIADMNQKKNDATIQTLSNTVSLQRKSLVDVQMDYENTSAQLQSEIGKRKLCMEKILYTQDMCQLLKQQTGDINLSLEFLNEFKKDVLSESRRQQNAVKMLSDELENIQDSFKHGKKKYLSHVKHCQRISKLEKLEKHKLLLDLSHNVKFFRSSIEDHDLLVQTLAKKATKAEDKQRTMVLYFLTLAQDSENIIKQMQIKFQFLGSTFRDMKNTMENRCKQVFQNYQNKQKESQFLLFCLKTYVVAYKSIQSTLTEHLQKLTLGFSQFRTSVYDMQESLKMRTTTLVLLQKQLMAIFNDQLWKQKFQTNKLIYMQRLTCQHLKDYAMNQKHHKTMLLSFFKEKESEVKNLRQILVTNKEMDTNLQKELKHCRLNNFENQSRLSMLKLEKIVHVLVIAQLRAKSSFDELQIKLQHQIKSDFHHKLLHHFANYKENVKKEICFKDQLKLAETTIKEHQARLNIYASHCDQLTHIKDEQERDILNLRKRLSVDQAIFKRELSEMHCIEKPVTKATPNIKKASFQSYATKILSQSVPKHSTPKLVSKLSSAHWIKQSNQLYTTKRRGAKSVKRHTGVQPKCQSDNWFENDKVFGFFD